jgi:hypothetical protein
MKAEIWVVTKFVMVLVFTWHARVNWYDFDWRISGKMNGRAFFFPGLKSGMDAGSLCDTDGWLI